VQFFYIIFITSDVVIDAEEKLLETVHDERKTKEKNTGQQGSIVIIINWYSNNKMASKILTTMEY